MQTYLKTRGAGTQLMIFISLALGSLVVFSLTVGQLISTFTGVPLSAMSDAAQWGRYPNMIWHFRIFTLLNFLALYLVPSLLFGYFADPRPLQFLGLRRPWQPVYWIAGIVLVAVSTPMVEGLGILNGWLKLGGELQEWMVRKEAEAQRLTRFLLSGNQPADLVANLVFVAVLAGVGEELFFRGVLQRIFIQLTRSPWVGILLSAALFSAFHQQFFGFLPRLALGALLGAIYWYSGSLWTAILVHFLYDALLVTLIYFNPALAGDPNATLAGRSALPLTAAVSAVLTAVVLWQMAKASGTRFADVYQADEPEDH
jgi:membrane protease YdiL (CAAX protease family)